MCDKNYFYLYLYIIIYLQDKGDTLDVLYYDGMSSMVANYIDLELMSNQ